MQKRRCPYIGLDTDPTTVMAYPTLRNCCHRVQPEEPVNLNYQLTHCFTFAHRHCPVLLEQKTEGLPSNIAIYNTKKRATIALWFVVASGMLTAIFVLLFGDWQWSGANGSLLDFNGGPVQQEIIQTSTLQPEPSASATSTFTSTATITIKVSATPLPSETLEPTDNPATDEPTSTHTNVPIATNYPTWTPIILPTNTAIPTSTATLFPTSTSQPAETDLPPNTPLPTETLLPTDPPPSDTPLPTDTQPPVPSDTPITLPTDPPPPTGTSTPIPLPPTNTPVP